MGGPFVNFWLYPSASGTEEILKTSSVGEPIDFFIQLSHRQKLTQPLYNLMCQPSAKSCQNISLYQELSQLVPYWELQNLGSD